VSSQRVLLAFSIFQGELGLHSACSHVSSVTINLLHYFQTSLSHLIQKPLVDIFVFVYLRCCSTTIVNSNAVYLKSYKYLSIPYYLCSSQVGQSQTI
jgi:hypothetical protein